MLQVKTKLKVIDNSGVKNVECIKVYKGKFAKISDIVLISVKELYLSNIKIFKGDLFKAIVIRTVYKNKNYINNYISFNENSVILLNKQNEPMSSRILGPVPLKFRQLKFLKIISIASFLL